MLYDFFNNLYSQYGLYGVRLDIAIALTLTFMITIGVVIIGFIVDICENICIKIISGTAGEYAAFILCNRLTFPGVIFHEFAHAFLITIFGGKVNKIKLLEFNDSSRLGYVNFTARGSKGAISRQLTFGSSAPVLLGLIALYSIYFIITRYAISIYTKIGLWYLFISIALHMSMSREDIKNYLRGVIHVIPVVFIFTFAIQFFFYA